MGVTFYSLYPEWRQFRAAPRKNEPSHIGSYQIEYAGELAGTQKDTW